MKRLALAFAVAAVLGALVAPAAASARPLGNFTINRSATLDLSGDRLYVSYVLDLAEIPTFQDRQAGVGPGDYLRRIERGLRVLVAGRPVALAPVAQRIAHPRGQGGLRTTRFEAILAGPAVRGTAAVELRDETYGGRIGWKEVVVDAGHGASVVTSSAPRRSASDDLRAYPKNLLRSPLDVTAAEATLSAGSAPGPAPTLSSAASLQAPDRVADHGFTSLIARGRLSAGVILVSLLVAAFWGAVHALTPGHGKALVAGYLVGTKGRPRHAVLLGATVTVTHTAGVFALGLVTLVLSQFVVPETLYPWLTLASGLLVVGVGLSVLRQRLRTGGWHGHGHGGDGHAHSHGRPHRHSRHHHGWRELGVVQLQGGGAAAIAATMPVRGAPAGDALTSRGILGVGVAAGILP